jgi:hypothetical protein
MLAIALAGCSVSEPADDPRPAPLGTYGTDAQLRPSEPDAVLRYGRHPRGFAELRLPEGAGPFPLAVIFHGGCWKAGIADTAYMAPLATRWQQLGVATLNVDYREVGDGGGWPGSFEDWIAAADLLDGLANRYPIDRNRVTLVGHSAGALPALWLPTAQSGDAPGGARAPVQARAAIVLDGPGDVGREQAAFDALCEFSSVAPFIGVPDNEGAKRLAALVPHPALEDVLFVQARLPAPPSTSQDAIRASGARLAVRTNPAASHFEVITPGDPAYTANEAAMMAILKAE